MSSSMSSSMSSTCNSRCGSNGSYLLNDIGRQALITTTNTTAFFELFQSVAKAANA